MSEQDQARHATDDGEQRGQPQPQPRRWLDIRVPLGGRLGVPLGWVMALVVGVSIAGSMAIYHEVVDPLYHADRWSEVMPDNVYRSAAPPPLALKAMFEEHRFERVIKLTGHAPQKHRQAKEYEAIEALGLELREIPMPGNGLGTPEDYVEALALMHESAMNGRKTLVHCAAGTHRTGGVIAAYRMLVQGWPADRAYDEMQAHGFSHTHNTELVPYLNENLPRIAEGLVERGVIAKTPDQIETIRPD